MLAHPAILSKIYYLKPILITVKCLCTQNICFVFYITNVFNSFSLFLYQSHLKTPSIYTKTSFNILTLVIGFTQAFRTGNNFSLAGGHVEQIPKIFDVQAKFQVVITFAKMPQQPSRTLWLGHKFNFVFWIL